MKGFWQLAVGVVAVLLFFSAEAHGDAWTSKRLTNNTGYSYDPSIAVDGANIYVVWWDYTPGNPEIYFKTGILF